jgi:hypothetical protein
LQDTLKLSSPLLYHPHIHTHIELERTPWVFSYGGHF